MVRRGERAAASRGDRAVGGDGRSVAHRAVRGHGVLADQRRVGVPHARAHAAEHQRSRHRLRAHAPAAQRSAAAARLRRRAAVGSMDRASDARRVLARARGHDEHREGPRAGAADLRLVRRLARSDRLHECARQACRGIRSFGSSWVRARTKASTTSPASSARSRASRRDASSSAGSITTCSARTTASTSEPPVDIFVFGDNAWRKEAAWPLARAVPTKWYLASGGQANTSAGDGVLDTIPPTRRAGRHVHLRSGESDALSSSTRASSRRRSTRISRRSTRRGATRSCSRRSRSRSRSR